MTDERDLNGVVLAGRYRVLEQIGVGGMGTVHAGEHIEVGRRVAIKILRPEASARPALVERFRREARVTARIEHENVVECLDVGVSDAGECFYVMEWLRGEDLQALLRREKTMAWPRARAILAQICRALAAAHERGVVHRDLKPGNVFLVQRGDNRDFVKLLDFGIAKLVAPDEAPGEALTRTGEVVGTTPYMAPELAAGEPFDHRIDIYAAGVILFQLLAGRLPFRGKTPRQILVEILKGDPPRVAEINPSVWVSPELEALLRRVLHRDANQRPADMAALHDALLDLPDDACRVSEGEAPDPSESEVAMVASVIGPMRAGNRVTGVDSGLVLETAITRVTVAEPPTAIEPPQRAASPRGLGLVLAGVLLGLAGVGGWFLWSRGGAPAIAEEDGERPVERPVEAVAPAEVEAKVEVVDVGPAPDIEAVADEPASDTKQGRGEARNGFEDIMRRAATRVRRCLAQGGVTAGTRVRFDIVVEAKTGRITAATPRAPFAGQRQLGACVVDATRGTSVRPPPSNEWRRSHEFAG